ncbi:protein GrpE isoform X1 [Benincasa hispida]|uniref:protein GrpE isoform X1 n=1 Tax=Benincasa hispida TaxID=102211 RepID=UPI0019029C13|nr:protein GrpE isoform X1 [Benincasa hispida]
MATLLRTPFFQATPPATVSAISSSKSTLKPSSLSLTTSHSIICCINSSKFSPRPRSLRFPKLLPFASSGETEISELEEEVRESEAEDSSVSYTGVEDATSDNDLSDDSEVNAEDSAQSVIIAALQSYKQALADNNGAQIVEIESFLKSIEEEKLAVETKLKSLTEELSVEKDRVLRISADFDNFRKRTERERLSLVKNAQGEVVETLLGVLDNFERARAQIKVETEGEEKINQSYQSIYKQFTEILGSLGVVPVETIGKPFDPLLHEAIMREDSVEFEEGIILDEFRKGFLLGERLLRPSMVKVSAGPGPEKSDEAVPAEELDSSEESASSEPESS